MFPVDLIDELFEKIVSYVVPQDVISLTETCHQTMVDVEALARRELDRIEREHNVGDTWRSRVVRVASKASQEGANGREGALIPNNISHRRMLGSVGRTHLYCVGNEVFIPQAGSILAMNPNGKHMLSAGGCQDEFDTDINLWDLATKKCIKSFPSCAVFNVGFSAGHIVSSSPSEDEQDFKVHIWSMDGTCKHDLTPLEGISHPCANAFAVSNDSVYVVEAEGPIRVIETITGTVRSMTEQPWGDHNFVCVGLGVCKNYLLHLRGEEYENDEEVMENYGGVYIFDRDSEQLQSRFPGGYSSMTCNLDGDVTLSSYGGQIQIFQVQDGHLIPRRCLRSRVSRVLHVAESRIFVLDKTPGESRPWIAVYDAENGMVERRLCCPKHYVGSMTSNEKEVFVGFSLGRRGYREHYAIAAFLPL